MKLPEIIPLFPLPNVVLFPRMPLPLHVFEPRYRALVRDAASAARLIGMALLRGDWERDYHGRPEIFAGGTVGEIVRLDQLPDGRFDIVLRGLREYTIVREINRAPYREAMVTWRDPTTEPLPASLRSSITTLVRRYLERLGREAGPENLLRGSVDDETFINFLAQHLDVAPVEKQALLEAPTLAARGHYLIDVLEFRLEEMRTPPPSTRARAH